MSLGSSFRRSGNRHKVRRADHRFTARRPRFETLEDRCLLSFTPGPSYHGGWNIGGEVAMADFNNDGYLDLATPNYEDHGTVSVLLGDGQGGFGDATLFSVGSNPLSVAVGDLNEDGKLDLAVANQGWYDPPSVGILLGNGDGTFGPVNPLPTSMGARSVAVGDFNADGHLDLGISISDGWYYTLANVRLGDGTGSFGEARWSDVLDGSWESATAADINGDGVEWHQDKGNFLCGNG